MSGVKDYNVSLRKSEYDRLMNSARRQDNLEANVQRRVDSARRDMQREMDRQVNSMQQRARQQESRIASLNSEIQSIERETQRQIKQQAKAFENKLQRAQNENRRIENKLDDFAHMTNERFNAQQQEYRSMIAAQSEEFHRTMEANKRQLESKIATVQRSIELKEQGKQERASLWSTDTETLIETIAESYRHDKFKPGEVAQLREQIRLAKHNSDYGDYEACISGSQQAFLNANKLRIELEMLEQEWLLVLLEANNQTAEALAMCQAQEQCQLVFETEDGDVSLEVEINYWTNNRLEELKQQVQVEQKRLKESGEHLTTEELKASALNMMALQHECLVLTEQAKQALLASQQRQNITCDIEDVLAKSGWDLVDDTYEGEDYREAHHAKFRNYQGDEIVTIVEPVEDNRTSTISNKLNLSYFDHTNQNRMFTHKILGSIHDQLSDTGINIGAPSCAPGTEHSSCRDVEKLDFNAVRNKTQKKGQ